MGHGRVRRDQVTDQIVGADELDDVAVESQHLSDDAKDAVLEHRNFVLEAFFNFDIMSACQSFDFPVGGVSFVSNVNSGSGSRAFAEVAAKESITTFGKCSDTNKILLTNRKANASSLSSSSLGDNSAQFIAVITFVSPGNTASSFDLTFDADENQMKWGTGSYTNVAEGYFVLTDTTTSKWIVIKLSAGGGSLSGTHVYSIGLSADRKVGVFDAERLPIEIGAGSYTALYPSVTNFKDMSDTALYGVAVAVNSSTATAFYYRDTLTVGGTLGEGDLIDTLNFAPVFPSEVGDDNSAALSWLELVVNGEVQDSTRFSYDISTREVSWQYAGFSLTVDDIVEASYPRIV